MSGSRIGGFLYIPGIVKLWESPGRAGGLPRSNYHVALYGAMLTDGALAETAIFKAKLDNDFKFATLAAGAKIGNLFEWIDFELEGQAVKHLEGQHHWEFNGLVIARWLRFPWNDIVKTSFAVGEGLSLATNKSVSEEKYNGEKTDKFLN